MKKRIIIFISIVGLLYVAYSMVSSYNRTSEQTETVTQAEKEYEIRAKELKDRQLEAAINIDVLDGKITRRRGDSLIKLRSK